MIPAAGNARGDVIVDEVGHAELIDEAIARGQIDARLPFLGADRAADRRKIGRVGHGSPRIETGGRHGIMVPAARRRKHLRGCRHTL